MDARIGRTTSVLGPVVVSLPHPREEAALEQAAHQPLVVAAEPIPPAQESHQLAEGLELHDQLPARPLHTVVVAAVVAGA